MHQDFSTELFYEDAKKIIGHTRTICDLKFLLKKIHKKGAVSFGLEESASFVDAMSAITDYCRLFNKEEILRSYREFLVIHCKSIAVYVISEKKAHK